MSRDDIATYGTAYGETFLDILNCFFNTERIFQTNYKGYDKSKGDYRAVPTPDAHGECGGAF